MPLNVRSCGHHQLDAQSLLYREPGNFLQIFWCEAGSGSFSLGRAARKVRPHTTFYYTAGEEHRIQASQNGLSYRWLTLDGPSAKSTAALFGWNRTQNSGECPVRLFEELDACLSDATAGGDRRASILAYEILLQAVHPPAPALPAGKEQTLIRDLREKIDRQYRNADLNVSTLADAFGIHRSTLYRLFQKHYGVSPVQYLNRVRLGRALEMLQQSGLPIAEIAARSGLPDLAYFSKRIHRHTGYSPSAYRRRHGETYC